jgi:non-ribosomal peptide synthetase component F
VFTTVLSVFKILLYIHSGQDDILVGIPVANRTHLEFEEIIGFFVNTVVIRSSLSGDKTFTTFFKEVKETFLEADRHQIVPLEQIIDALKIERS